MEVLPLQTRGIIANDQVRIVYNPYVLHLLYVKLRYLTTVVRYYYDRYAVGDRPNDRASLNDCCVLNNLYCELMTEELAATQNLMTKENFPIALSYMHHAFYVFRFMQSFRMKFEPQSALFGSIQYACEKTAITVIVTEEHKMLMQHLVRRYVEEFYLSCGTATTKQIQERTERRVELFFHVKRTMEKEVEEACMDKENTQCFIRYDNELVATLFYIHLVEELMVLQERDNGVVIHEDTLGAYKFAKRGLYKADPSSSPSSSTHTPTAMPSSTSSSNTHNTILPRLMFALCQKYRDQVVACIRYYFKTPPPSSQSGVLGWLTGASSSPVDTGSATSTTDYNSFVLDKAESIELYNKHLNSAYALAKPRQEAFTRVSTNHGITMIRKVGHSDFYGQPQQQQQWSTHQVVVPVEYAVFRDNKHHYTHFLYRLAFEMSLVENHACATQLSSQPKTSPEKRQACYLCEYLQQSEMNKKLANFFMFCKRDVENPEHTVHQIDALHEELDTIHLDLQMPLALRIYKTLVNVMTLFGYQPLKLHNGTQFMVLFKLINPVRLLKDLSNTVVITKLETKMQEVLKLCYAKLNFKNETVEQQQALYQNEMVEQEQALAMEIELVRLISEAISLQQSDIQRYERSLSTLMSTESSELFSQVFLALKTIATAYVDVLCQVIVQRRGTVTL